MKEGLSLLCKTGNGLAHAYVKLEVKDRCVCGGPDEDCENCRAPSPFPPSFLVFIFIFLVESLDLSYPGPMRKDRISFSEALRLPVSQLFWGIGDREYGEGGRIPAGLPHLSFKVSVLCLSLTPTFSSFASPLQPIPHSSPLYKSFPYNLLLQHLYPFLAEFGPNPGPSLCHF